MAVRALERFLDRRFATRRGGLGLTEIATDAVQVALHETHRIPDWDHFLSFARTVAVRLVLRCELKRGKRRSLAEAIGIPDPRSGETDGELEEAVVAASLGMDIENVEILCGMIRGEPSLAEQVRS